jgi:hypothetical protein
MVRRWWITCLCRAREPYWSLDEAVFGYDTGFCALEIIISYESD